MAQGSSLERSGQGQAEAAGTAVDGHRVVGSSGSAKAVEYGPSGRKLPHCLLTRNNPVKLMVFGGYGVPISF